MRYFLWLAYRGTAYAGWQRQKNALSVQEVVEQALATLLGGPMSIMGSGRTDAGVHALQQVAHFDTAEAIDQEKTVFALNALLPEDIRALQIRQVMTEAHTRFDAIRRGYVYQIARKPTPFLPKMAYAFHRELDVAAMNAGAAYFLGQQDFQSLSKRAAKVNHYLCEVFEARWQEQGDLLCYHVAANRFLHGMVRAMVGTLLDVGQGKIEPSELKAVLAKKDRTMAGRAAPPEGLFLNEVRYPPAIFID
jgi:tRNA pseudouridine38-40 synthase